MSVPDPKADDVEIVDARGLYCPVPILRLRRRIKGAPVGRLVTLLATDPAAPPDVAAYCREDGHALIGQSTRVDGVIELTVRAGGLGPFPR